MDVPYQVVHVEYAYVWGKIKLAVNADNKRGGKLDGGLRLIFVFPYQGPRQQPARDYGVLDLDFSGVSPCPSMYTSGSISILRLQYRRIKPIPPGTRQAKTSGIFGCPAGFY